jgi:DNA-binding MarR family transcriptional regulator
MSTTTITRPDVEAFNVALDQFLRAQRQARGRFNSAPSVPELSMSQYHLLEPLARAEDGAMCVGAIAESAGVSPPSATRMLDGLARRGLVERRRDAADRRLVHVALTEHGRELLDAKRRRMVDARTKIFDALSPSEQRTAARLLSSLAAAIDDLHP